MTGTKDPNSGDILTINAGSSSIKFALFESNDSLKRILEGKIERIGLNGTNFKVKGPNKGDNFSQSIPKSTYSKAAEILIDWIEKRTNGKLIAVGHRFVNGGPKYIESQIVTKEMLKELHRIKSFDPEHMPGEIMIVEIFGKRFPKLPQIACFDTAFHHAMPRIAHLLPIPLKYYSKGIRRYGFHGISYSFLMEKLASINPNAAKGKVILAHLGNGASLAAVKDGKPMDTSMGFTPTSGIPMSTRTGDLDPGLVWYLKQNEHINEKQFNKMVNSQSGLLGLSETSSDMRDLLDCESKDARAADAIALFCYQVKKYIGSFTAAICGLDILVFSGGMGENAPKIRKRICAGLEFLGIKLDEKQNESNSELISTKDSKVAVYVIKTDEESMIAKTVRNIYNIDKA